MSPIDNEKTKDRLMSAALSVFSRAGFKSASIRDICSTAGANIASVNYHFGTKEELYRATVAHFTEQLKATNELLELSRPKESLEAYFRKEVASAAEPSSPLYALVRIRHLEEVAPSGLLEDFLQKSFLAKKAYIDQFIDGWANGELPSAAKDELCLALLSLPTTYVMCRPWLVHSLPPSAYESGYLDRYSKVLASQALTLMNSSLESRPWQ